jgi:hypothetical protein
MSAGVDTAIGDSGGYAEGNGTLSVSGDSLRPLAKNETEW